MSLEIGSKVGPYKILDTVGAGGMGEVYRARDTRLQRDVAIKVLPQRHVDNEEARARFEREAQAVAALSHPNIVSIFDFGFIDEKPYAVSELLQGESLRSRLSSGPLSWQQAAEFGMALSEGLAAAHSKGIIHRDLKPENIFITEDERIKILDFGLASVEGVQQLGPHSSAPTAITKTEPGTVLGTVGYMSPEQVRGMPTDERSDIFSLGAILFEMITGQRAFQGETSSDIMAAILRDEVSGTGESGVSIPLQLEKVVRGCLSKDPRQRPQSAREVRAELKAALGAADSAAFTPMPEPSSTHSPPPGQGRRASIRPALYALAVLTAAALLFYAGTLFWDGSDSGREAGPVRSLAVLPFQFEEAAEDGSDGSTQLAYLSKEVVEGLINRLSQVEELQVMAWSTVSRYQGSVEDPLEAGRQLQVDAVLSGRVSRREETVTVQATLLDTRQGFQIWGDRFQEPFSRSGAFQEQVASNVVQRLGYEWTGEPDFLAEGSAPDPEAFNHYLEARHKPSEKRMAERDAAEVGDQIESYLKALEIDKDFVKAQQGLAEALSSAGAAGHLDPGVVMPMAKAAAVKLLDLKRGNAEVHGVLATVYSRFERDWDRAEDEFEQAMEMNPRSAETLQQYAMDYLVPTGQLDEAENALRKAMRLKPGSAALLFDLGRVHYFQRRYDQAIDVLGQADSKGSPGLFAEQYTALSHLGAGRPRAAVEVLEGRLRGGDPQEAFNPARHQAMAVLGLAYGRSGDRDKVERVLRNLSRPGAHLRRLSLYNQSVGRDRRPRPSQGSAPPPLPPAPPSVPREPPAPDAPFPGRELVLGEWGSRPYWMALVQLGLGDEEQALRLIQQAVRTRAAEAVYLKVDPVMDPLRGRAAFEELIEELGLD
ncbi:MAG TPA: protein kinase [Acidobacteriota bacterium]|nr:protein kinase [Acidobacteriota bacterium]